MTDKFKDLLGFEGSIIDLSNKLECLGCEDICYFSNWSEILEHRSVVVSTDECGDNHIKVHFDVTFTNGEDEVIEATNIKITNIEKY